MRPAGLTAANWRTHPYAPWAFANADEFLPTAEVAAPAAIRPLAEGPPLSLPAEWDTFLRDTHADGVIVIHRSAVVIEAYAPRFCRSQRHLAFSISKAITGLLAETLIAEGILDSQALVADLVPGLVETPFANASLEALLEMRDGVAFDENYADPNADIHRYSQHFWGAGEGGVAAALRQFGKRGTNAEDSFSYRTPVTDVIGLAVTAIAQASLEGLTRRLWSAAGAENSALWVRDTAGREVASAGFGCTLRDLGRLGCLVIDAANGTGDPILQAAVARIQRGGDPDRFARADQPTRPGYSYRSGWWIDHPRRALNALGVFGQRLHVRPGERLVIARFGSNPTASNQASDLDHARWFDCIAASLS